MDNVLLLLPRKPVIGHQKTLTFMREEERLLSFWGTSFGFDGLEFVLAASLTR